MTYHRHVALTTIFFALALLLSACSKKRGSKTTLTTKKANSNQKKTSSPGGSSGTSGNQEGDPQTEEEQEAEEQKETQPQVQSLPLQVRGFKEKLKNVPTLRQDLKTIKSFKNWKGLREFCKQSESSPGDPLENKKNVVSWLMNLLLPFYLHLDEEKGNIQPFTDGTDATIIELGNLIENKENLDAILCDLQYALGIKEVTAPGQGYYKTLKNIIETLEKE